MNEEQIICEKILELKKLLECENMIILTDTPNNDSYNSGDMTGLKATDMLLIALMNLRKTLGYDDCCRAHALQDEICDELAAQDAITIILKRKNKENIEIAILSKLGNSSLICQILREAADKLEKRTLSIGIGENEHVR